jgi:hypothetical protein
MTTASAQDRQERAAKNQSLFREVNERVRDMNQDSYVFTILGDWVCECANDTCVERLSLSTRAYEAIRQQGARFLVAPGDQHVWPDVERVIEMNDEYWIVEKFERAAEIAMRADPRSDQRPLRLRT